MNGEDVNAVSGSQPEESVADPNENKWTIGKKIGFVAFLVTELVILVSLGLTWYDWKDDKHFDTNSLTNIVFYQIVVLTVTWGGKASSNIADAMKAKFGK